MTSRDPGTPPPPARQAGPPVLRVVSGDATAEEIAALVAVLASRPRAGAGEATATPARSAWSDRYRLIRAPLLPGPGAWRRSALPW